MTEVTSIAINQAAMRLALNRASEQLLGIISGILADGELHDREVQYLRTWLLENEAIASAWPGNAVAKAVHEVLLDGVITADERTYLARVLTEVSNNDFATTGAATPSPSTLPIEDSVTIILRDCAVCHTGEFLFGTRSAVERATMRAGGMPVDNVSKKVEVLVIGSRVSPQWAHTSYGRKIEKAVQLQEAGHPIEIISEKRWLQALE